MKYFIFYIIFLCLIACSPSSGSKVTKKEVMINSKPIVFAQSEQFQLSKTIVEIDSVLFKNSCVVRLQQSAPDATIYYTVDNSDPDSSSLKYDGSIVLKQSATLKVKAIHPIVNASETVSQQVLQIKSANIIDEIILNTPANEKYPGGGASSLLDMQKGNLNYKMGNDWSGFKQPDVKITIRLKKATTIKFIHLSCLKDYGSWIFLPAALSCSSNGKLIGEKKFPEPLENENSSLAYLSLPLEQYPVSEITLRVESLTSIPDWHQGKGTTPWLFIDEIILE